METPIPVDLGRIAQDLQIRRVQVESVVQLLDEGNTVPFITRYRKERTGGLNELVIREIQARVARLRDLAQRKETILKAIEAQGKLNDELAAAIRSADNPKRLEDLYLPYKPKKRTKAIEAREKGLEPLALRIWNRDETLTDLNTAAAEFINPEKGVETAEQALEGVGHILAESINELANVRDAVRRVVWKLGKIVTTKMENVAEGQGLDFRDYFNYTEPIHHIPPHRVLALNRGDKENVLRVKLEVPRADLERTLASQLPLEGHPHQEFFTRAALDALDRLLMPSLEREIRRDLTEGAERHAVEVFARNLRSLLLQPPINRQTVLAIDPGFRTGCKVAVLDPYGKLLAHEVIHPHQPQNRRAEAKLKLKELVATHEVGVVAIGNGTACRETEELIAELIAEGTYFHQHPGATTYPGKPAPEPAAGPSPAEAGQATAPPPQNPGESEIPTADLSTPPSGLDGGSEPESSAEAVTAEPQHESPPPSESTPAPESEPSAETPPPIAGGGPQEDEQPVESAPAEPIANQESSNETPSSDVPTPVSEQAASTPVEIHSETEPEPAAAPQPPAEAPSTEPESTQEPVPVEAATPAAPTAESKGATEEEIVRPIAADFTHPPIGPKPKPAVQEPRPPRPPKPRPAPPPPGPHRADPLLEKLSYVIVNEAGASVYSTSPVGREEFPDLDATTRSAASIGRRLQDPLAELVKIEPQNIGVGLYQHDVSPKHLKESLEQVVESCVNFVGVDLNTASVSLLRFVSGLNALTAKRLFDYRVEHGPFTSREQINQVEGIGPATFTQAAGFLKIRDTAHPFDRTWIHPESYEVATRLLERLGYAPDVILDKEKLAELNTKLGEVDIPAVARELNVGEPTLHDIIEALARPERDPREDLPKPIFKKGVLKLEDLSAGMELKGTVLNVVDFGAFVDIGLKDSGLVHISQLANRYVKSPHDVVSVGDVVTVWVLGVDGERKRVSLTMVPPGTERPRGGGGRRGQGQAAPGQGPSAGETGPGGEGRPERDRERRPGGGRREGGRPRQGGPGAREGGAAAEATGSTPARPPEPQRNLRIPGPPQRLQQRGRGGQGGGRRPDRRFERSAPEAPAGAAPATPSKPRPKPTAPEPLSDAAKTGKVPLRTFGQLKQLYEAREEKGAEDQPPAESPDTSPADQTGGETASTE